MILQMKINAENLQKSYFIANQVEVKALKNISVEINQGESVAIMGPSGAGKSTFLHLLGLMDKPTGGKLYLNGIDYACLNENEYSRARREKIGFIFQMHYLLPDFTVYENVLMPVWGKSEEIKAKALDIIDKLGLSERLEHMPSELSGGEQQRVALARAFIKGPEIIMADEPTGNLDRDTGEKVEKILFDECKERNISLILVTHNPELAVKAGRIIKMRDGLVE